MIFFVTIEPSVAAAETLVLLQEDLAPTLRQLGYEPNWTAAENLHLVLHSVDAEAAFMTRWRDAISTVAKAHSAPSWSLRGVRFDPSDEVPRRLVAGVETSQAIADIQQALDGAAQELGARPCPAWDGGLQVGRMRRGDGAMTLQGVSRPYEATVFGESLSSELVLWKSEVVGGEQRRRVLHRYAFGTGL